MTTRASMALLKKAEKFLQQHKGHVIEGSSSEPHYFNLWCINCENGNWAEVNQGSSRDRAAQRQTGKKN